MAMGLELRSKICLGLFMALIAVPFPSSAASISSSKAISDLRDVIVKGLGFQAEDFKITGFDMRDALVGRSVAYEFDVEIDKKVQPFKLLEDVNKWEFVDLPIFRPDPLTGSGLVEKGKMDYELPVLAPFQLAGPMELWIQDAKDMRISLPHDVDAGVLKKVILADGAVVTVKGARSVSLRHPVELPLPFNRTNNGFASGLLHLAERLRHMYRASPQSPLLSLRIVGPTSLTSPSSSATSSSNRLKLKRLAPGLVELSSASKLKPADGDALSAIDMAGESTALLSPNQFTTLWPVASLNGSNANLLGLESLLSSVLGAKASKKGSFKLLKADVSAQTFVKIGFGIEKKLKEGDDTVSWDGFPAWRTKPEYLRMHFEVLAKVDGDKVVPEKILQVNPVMVEDVVTSNVLTGNITMTSIPVVYPPQDPFSL